MNHFVNKLLVKVDEVVGYQNPILSIANRMLSMLIPETTVAAYPGWYETCRSCYCHRVTLGSVTYCVWRKTLKYCSCHNPECGSWSCGSCAGYPC